MNKEFNREVCFAAKNAMESIIDLSTPSREQGIIYAKEAIRCSMMRLENAYAILDGVKPPHDDDGRMDY
jgi:hypothetical protein